MKLQESLCNFFFELQRNTCYIDLFAKFLRIVSNILIFNYDYQILKQRVHQGMLQQNRKILDLILAPECSMHYPVIIQISQIFIYTC